MASVKRGTVISLSEFRRGSFVTPLVYRSAYPARTIGFIKLKLKSTGAMRSCCKRRRHVSLGRRLMLVKRVCQTSAVSDSFAAEIPLGFWLKVYLKSVPNRCSMGQLSVTLLDYCVYFCLPLFIISLTEKFFIDVIIVPLHFCEV